MAVVLATALAVAGGCGVSTSSPQKHGDSLPAVQPYGESVRSIPDPAGVSDPEELVRLYLQAAVGGTEAVVPQVKAFLTGKALESWRDPANPQNVTVIRVLRGPEEGVRGGGRSPVTVDYEVIGTLSNGRVAEPSPSGGGSITFWVVPDPNTPGDLRIDEIQGWHGGLLLSDKALDEAQGGVHRIQPVYFWDAEYELLIPDLRYLPLTLNEEQRAKKLAQWLVAGPSPWLEPAPQRLPAGTNLNVAIRTDPVRFEVNIETEQPFDQTAVARLHHQLRWTLSYGGIDPPPLELFVNGQPQQSGVEDYRAFNRAYRYRNEAGPPGRYDVVDSRVAAVGLDPQPPLLTAADNADVETAAVNRDGTVAALVRRASNGLRYLNVIHADGRSVRSELRQDVSRPSWVPVPGSREEFVMVASGGNMYLLSTTDPQFTDVTPARLTGVTSVSVAPDGRRIAFVADGLAYVASLSVNAVSNTVTVGSNPRPILASRAEATSVAWLNDTWLMVGGVANGANTPAIWRVSADGVVARDETPRPLRDAEVQIQEVLAAPAWPAGLTGPVYLYTNQGVYEFSVTVRESQFAAPFFGN